MLMQSYSSSWANLCHCPAHRDPVVRPSGLLDGRCAVPRIAWHLLLILLPVVAAFAILPGLYSNHLMLSTSSSS